MGLTLPTPGDTTDVWGDTLNTALGLIDQHDHTTGKGVPIPAAALSIDGDVSWGIHAITAMSALGFTEITASAATAYSDALYVNSSDHNLYFRNSSGAAVQITSGDTINVSIVGGIGGDYSTVGALLSYDDATRRYLLQQEGSPRPWAGLATGDIDLYQKAASIANKITIKSPSSLAASYTLQLPTALPASTTYLTVNSSGFASLSVPIQTTRTFGLTPSDPFVVDVGATPTITQLLTIRGGIDISLSTPSGASNDISIPIIPLAIDDEPLSVVVHAGAITSTATVRGQLFYQPADGSSRSAVSLVTNLTANGSTTITCTLAAAMSNATLWMDISTSGGDSTAYDLTIYSMQVTSTKLE